MPRLWNHVSFNCGITPRVVGGRSQRNIGRSLQLKYEKDITLAQNARLAIVLNDQLTASDGTLSDCKVESCGHAE